MHLGLLSGEWVLLFEKHKPFSSAPCCVYLPHLAFFSMRVLEHHKSYLCCFSVHVHERTRWVRRLHRNNILHAQNNVTSGHKLHGVELFLKKLTVALIFTKLSSVYRTLTFIVAFVQLYVEMHAVIRDV
jgi:hypothetical protein